MDIYVQLYYAYIFSLGCVYYKVPSIQAQPAHWSQTRMHTHTRTNGSCPVHWVTLKNKHTSAIIVAESLQSRSQKQQRSVRELVDRLPSFLIQQYRLVVSHAALVALTHTANKTSRRIIQHVIFLLHNSVLYYAR